MKGMLDGAENGYVSLPDGRKVKEESFRAAHEANTATLGQSAKHTRTSSSFAALKDGHMSKTEARRIYREVQMRDEVLTMGEHYNARTVLNNLGNRGIMNDPQFSQRDNENVMGFELYSADKSLYHGAGCFKWCHSDGREIVNNASGSPELRDEFMGTFNFDKNGKGHVKLDVLPYYDWGNTPHDTSTYNQRVGGPDNQSSLKSWGIHRFMNIYGR